jgi:hypothetical protein
MFYILIIISVEHVFDKIPKYHVKNLLGNVNAKIRR